MRHSRKTFFFPHARKISNAHPLKHSGSCVSIVFLCTSQYYGQGMLIKIMNANTTVGIIYSVYIYIYFSNNYNLP